jgi:hypothetical protein
MQNQLNELSTRSDIIYAVVLVLLSLLLISLSLVIIVSYRKTKNFLRSIINIGSNREVNLALENLYFFQGFLVKKLHGINAGETDKLKYTSKLERTKYKKGNTKKLANLLVTRLAFLLLILIVPFILTWQGHVIFLDSAANIMPVIKDINNLNNILYSSLPIVSLTGLIFLRPFTIAKGHLVYKIVPSLIQQA